MSNNTNNFYGNVSGVQIQQGTNNSKQSQVISLSNEMDYNKVAELIEKIKKYDCFFENEYGQQAMEVRNNISELEKLVQEKASPSKVKLLLMELKNLSVGITGSLIATGIVELIKPFL